MNQIMMRYRFNSLHNQHLLNTSKKNHKKLNEKELLLFGTIHVLVTSFCKLFMG